MKNRLPLSELPEVLQNLHQNGFRLAFETDECGMLDVGGRHFLPFELSILEEMEFLTEESRHNAMSLFVCECMDGQLGYALINWPCANRTGQLRNMMGEIPRVTHDEWKPLWQSKTVVDTIPQSRSEIHSFKMIF